MISEPTNATPRIQHSPIVIGLLVTAALLGCGLFAALGTWQLQRRNWKLDLIQRVDARVHQPPVSAPARQDWPAFAVDNWDYRRVSVTGRYLPGQQTLVRALTITGSGFWVMTPLRLADGGLVLINRGFVAVEHPQQSAAMIAPSGDISLTGLLRRTEPSGLWPRVNDPRTDRWFSRDVTAIAAARALDPIAPYFVDADATLSASGGPVGGLTVIVFANNHLGYALTWFALAAMIACAVIYLACDQLVQSVPRRKNG